MTNELAVMLIGPITALAGAALMGALVMYRIHRYGRVFNWPPVPAKASPPPAVKHHKK